jgi:hypothetical protein
MSNPNRPSGFRPVRHLNGSAWNGQAEVFAIAAADATAIGVGDLVKLVAGSDTGAPPTSQVTPVVVPGYGQVTRIAAGSDIPAGVVVGFIPNYSNLNLPSQYHAASTGLRYALVCIDPTVIYEAQFSGTFVPASTVGKNASPTVTATSASTGISGMQVDSATVATTATLSLKILQVAPKVEYDPSDTANVKLWVTLNSNSFGNGTGAAGV